MHRLPNVGRPIGCKAWGHRSAEPLLGFRAYSSRMARGCSWDLRGLEHRTPLNALRKDQKARARTRTGYLPHDGPSLYRAAKPAFRPRRRRRPRSRPRYHFFRTLRIDRCRPTADPKKAPEIIRKIEIKRVKHFLMQCLPYMEPP